MSLRRGIGATYRIQLGPRLGFFQAAAIVPYLAALGIETLYCSPIAEAVPKSPHGYDGIEPTMLRRELGGEVGYAALVAACEAHGLGILVDLVPNHLATYPMGPWWRRLLAEGPDSEIAEVFDVDWDWPAAKAKVTLPLLDRPLPDALAAGAVRLGERDGTVVLLVGNADLPVAGGAASLGDDVAEVLAAQHYRLVDWHDAADRNYRRFFDIDGLVGVRVEIPEVFAATHELVISLARSGRLSALRVDHIDGLREPTAYLARLAAACDVPIVVEKILSGDEVLRDDWPVLGTTGYEVIDDLAGALVDPAGLERLRQAAAAEGETDPGPLSVATRRLVAEASFPGELARFADALGVGTKALVDTVVALPRYRTYLDATERREEDVAIWHAAGQAAGTTAVADAIVHPASLNATLGLQQLTGAIMAKGVEDTAWYRLAGPLALCEVGGDPGRPRQDGLERLVARALDRQQRHQAGLIPGTTHDTKRSEDVRCRLYALSEVDERFGSGLARFRRELNLPEDGSSFGFETRLVAELALGVLPPLEDDRVAHGYEPIGDAVDGDAALCERFASVLRKAAREAKEHSSWRAPDEDYEERLIAIGTRALERRGELLRACFGSLVDELCRLGAVNSLSAVLLRHVLPGIPDCYEGDERWDLSLVDPDNRRDINFEALANALAQMAGAGAGVADLPAMRRRWRDGRVKLLVTSRCLAARQRHADAFAIKARLEQLAANGPAAPSVIAAARHGAAGSYALGVATRHASALSADEGDLPAGPSYAGTSLALPPGAPQRFLEVLGGRKVAAKDGGLLLGEVLAELPVALLVALDPEA
ncbi:MAG: malto-oligosyltrehalose synthase [Actinomycetota bacterium]|nr:malto-oligosyltrehalose synthase [Actinomycetota bacterium]